MNLPKPFDTFRLELRAGEYKDFHIADNDPYPLKGVIFPTDYGDIQGYTGEDGHPLDVFVGTGNILGHFKVYRSDVEGQIEHKFLLNITEEEESQILDVFGPVVRGSGRYESFAELLSAIEPFKDRA